MACGEPNGMSSRRAAFVTLWLRPPPSPSPSCRPTATRTARRECIAVDARHFAVSYGDARLTPCMHFTVLSRVVSWFRETACVQTPGHPSLETRWNEAAVRGITVKRGMHRNHDGNMYVGPYSRRRVKIYWIRQKKIWCFFFFHHQNSCAMCPRYETDLRERSKRIFNWMWENVYLVYSGSIQLTNNAFKIKRTT